MAALLSLLFSRQQVGAARPWVVTAHAACARGLLHVLRGSDPSQLPRPHTGKEQISWSLRCPLSPLSVVQHAELFRNQPMPQCEAGKKRTGSMVGVSLLGIVPMGGKERNRKEAAGFELLDWDPRINFPHGDVFGGLPQHLPDVSPASLFSLVQVFGPCSKQVCLQALPPCAVSWCQCCAAGRGFRALGLQPGNEPPLCKRNSRALSQPPVRWC